MGLVASTPDDKSRALAKYWGQVFDERRTNLTLAPEVAYEWVQPTNLVQDLKALVIVEALALRLE